MKLEEFFEVDAPVHEVWKALIDVQRVAPCLPGAEITDAGEDGTYEGNFQVKLGPTTASYRGTLKLQSIDEAARVATMDASGRDKRGQGGAKATMVSTVTQAEGGGARVHVDTDFTITGRLARFGRGGMIQDISKRLLGEFAACLQEELDGLGGPAGEAAASNTDDAVAAATTAPTDSLTADAAPGNAATPERSARAAPARRVEPVRGFSLVLSVLLGRIRRFLRRRKGR
jgi:carbon monoxide dehydrogenase subunit G